MLPQTARGGIAIKKIYFFSISKRDNINWFKKMSLLDEIAEKLNCTYVSDLHDRKRYNDIARLISKLNYEDYSLWEWRNAYRYLKGKDGKKLDQETIYKSFLKKLKK